MSEHFGFFIDPKGVDRDVHNTPPYTHMGHAMSILDALEAEADDPLENLLRRGWIRISHDEISVYDLGRARTRIARFVEGHRAEYEEIQTVFVTDEKADRTVRMSWKELLED